MAKKEVVKVNEVKTEANMVNTNKEETVLELLPGESLNNELLSQLLDGEEFVNIGAEKRVYRAESCKDQPLVGFPIDIKQFDGSATNPNGFEMAIIRTTKPTTVVVGKDSRGNVEVEDVGAGIDVMIVISHNLEKLKDIATQREMVRKVVIKPRNKREFKGKTGAIQQVWEFDLAVSKVAYPRDQVAPDTFVDDATSLVAAKDFAALEG